MRQKMMQQSDVLTLQQQGLPTGSPASSSAVPPPQNTVTSDTTPSASFIEVDLPTPQTQPQPTVPAEPVTPQPPTQTS